MCKLCAKHKSAKPLCAPVRQSSFKWQGIVAIK